MNDEAVAYIPSKKAPCKSLNYLSGKDEASIATCVLLFLIMCVPFIGTLIYLGNLGKIYTYYKEGSIHDFKKIPLISVIGACLVGMSFVSLITFFILGIPVAACFAYFSYVGDKLCDEGKKELFNRACNELEMLREKI